MEALIMSCSTGGGHNSAGLAVAEELRRRGHLVTMLDPYELVSEKTARLIGDSYVKLVQRSPQTFGCVYALGEAYRHLPIHSPVFLANKRMVDTVWKYLEQHHFDVIIMSHMYPAHIMASLKERGAELPQTILLATDYTCIPFMEEASCDYYVIPSVELRKEFCKRGIPDSQILPLGIPVRKEFYALSYEEAREQVHFERERSYILLSGGSIGVGRIEKAVKTCIKYLRKNPEWNLVVICGNNQKLFEKLSAAYGGACRIRILKSTAKMADYVKACDVFISKPGGLSSTEAAVSGKPLIHLAPIPGCESRNVKFFEKRGMSLYAKKPGWRLWLALKKLEKKAAVRQMLDAQAHYVNGKAVLQLCDFLEQKGKHSH